MRYDSQRLNQQTTAIGGGGVTQLIWVIGGIGHVTHQNRHIRIAIEQRDRNCKIGEGGGLACQNGRENTNAIFRGDVEELLLELLDVDVYSGRSK